MESTAPHCPTEAEIADEIPTRQRQFQSGGIFNFMRIYENPEFLLRYDLGDAIWAMCVKDLFTLDFDIKDGVSRDRALRYVQHYSDIMHSHGVDLLWAVYQSDRGMHFYLLSQRLLYSDDRALRMSLDLCTDKNYIVFSTFNGFCSRVAPKLKKQKKDKDGKPMKGKVMMSKEEIMQEFVSRPCHRVEGDIEGLKMGDLHCTVGYGTPDPYVEAVLYVYERLIDYFLDAYARRLSEQLEEQTYTWNGTLYEKLHIPSLRFLEETRDFAAQLMREVGIVGQGSYVIEPKYKGYLTEYKPFLEPTTLFRCARIHPSEINRRAIGTATESWTTNCGKQFISIAGPDIPDEQSKPTSFFPTKLVRNPTSRNYPFVFGVDASSYMIFIQFRDLLMLDWDTKDGIPKSAAPQILNRFLRLEDELSRVDRIFPGDLAFRLLETDNGIHAFCVSHFQVYDDRGTGDLILSDPLNIMRHLCVDPWYIAFVKVRGYSIRMGPKIINKGRDGGDISFKTPDEINSQFIQRYGVDIPGRSERLHYLGKGRINPYLDALVEFIYDVQQYILKYPNVARRAVEDSAELAMELGEYVKELYDRKVRPLEPAGKYTHFINSSRWAQLIWRCDPKNPASLAVRK